jgi:hypothetical protein
MNIWTEQLQRQHLTLLERWLNRTAGTLTANDLPDNAELLTEWFEQRGQADFLISVYETPVGVGGLRGNEFYLFLGEVGYNLIRTAKFATLRILDQALINHDTVTAWVYGSHKEYLSALKKMGFSQIDEKGDMIRVSVQKKELLSRKYLF